MTTTRPDPTTTTELHHTMTATNQPLYELRGNQEASVESIVRDLGRTGQLHRACGTGKTLIMYDAAAQFGLGADDHVFVFCAPTIALVQQTIGNWYRYAGTPDMFDVLAVRSTSKADRRAEVGDDGQADYAATVASTTDPTEVAAWLTNRAGRSRLLVSTHVSLPRVTEALHQAGMTAAVVFVDEAHFLAGASIGKAKSGPVFDLCYSDRYQRALFATATPKTVAPHVKARASELGYGTFCMDENGPFGPVIGDPYPLRKAIDAGDLVDYQILVTQITDADLAKVATSDGVHMIGGTEVAVTEMVTHLAVAQSCTDHGLDRLIAFHNRIDDSTGWADRHQLVVAAPCPVDA